MTKTKQTKENKNATKVGSEPDIAKTKTPKMKCGKKPRDLSKAEEETAQKKSVIAIKHAYLRTFAIRLYGKNETL